MKKKDFKCLEKDVSIMNKKDINAIIENNKNKIIIFAGFFHAGMHHIEKKVDKGYMIDITPEKLWRQYNLRTVTYIHKNYNDIKKLLNSRIDPTKIHIIFNRKFGIRNGFECVGVYDFRDLLKNVKKDAKNKKYYYGTSDKIYKQICKLLL
jgi:hypothetical protein